MPKGVSAERTRGVLIVKKLNKCTVVYSSVRQRNISIHRYPRCLHEIHI